MNLAMRKAIRRRLTGIKDDTGSMPMVLLVIIVGLALGAMMIPMVITQDHATSFDNRRVHALNAAEAGLDVALGGIRSAVSGTSGVTAKLPCGPLTGSVDAAGTEMYSVALAYYTQNPASHDAAWLADPLNKMACVPNYGTYLHSTNEYVPSFVLMTSKGTDTSAGSGGASRTLQTTYIVQTSNTNISGGTIAIYPQSNGMCMAALSSDPTSPPAVGTSVALETCETDRTLLGTAPPDQVAPGPWPWQVWSYNADLSIYLVSSQSTTYPNGLCLDATTPHTNTSSVTLQPCTWPVKAGNTDPPYSTTNPKNPSHDSPAAGVVYNQEWSIDNSSHLEGAKSDKSDIDGYCLNVASQNPGTVLNLTTCTGGTTDQSQTWVPSPDAGAGSAGASNNQQVNFQQFGRCMDVTNQKVSGGTSADPGGDMYLIAYTCKQDPDPSKVAWNQKFVADKKGYGELITYYGGDLAQPYCLNSPLSAYASNGPYVNVVPCPSGKPASGSGVVWVTNGTTDSQGNTLTYADKFTVVDSAGLCLSLTPGSGDTYNGYSKTIVQACDGSTAQKWNAQANVAKPLLVNTIEK